LILVSDAGASPSPTGGADLDDARIDRAFGFIDLSGFTRYTDEYGDREAVKLLARFRTAVRDVSARRGVRVAKWLGDGAMLVSTDGELLATAVVEIAQRLQGEPLPLRCGVASGPVLLFEGDDYIGAAVNLAARLCAMARPGEVYATAALASSLTATTTATPVGSRVVAGIAEPVEVVRIDAANTADGAG